MVSSNIFYVGTEAEVGHHAAPLMETMPVSIRTAEEVVNEARPGNVAVFFSEHFERFRETIPQLKSRQVATLYAIDGILEWRNAWENRPDEPACPWTMRPALCHKVACIGPSQYRILAAWGNRDRVELVGVPRFDRLLEKRRALPDAIERLNRPGPKKILVATAKWPGFTPEQVEITKRSLADVRDFFRNKGAESSRDWQVTWRLTHGLERDLQVTNSLTETTGADLQSQIADHDIVVTCPSTAMVEAMLLGRPTVLLDYHNVPQWVPAAWQINHADQIEPVLTSLVAESQAEQASTARRFMWQERLLEDTLWCRAGATGRLVSLITAMQRTAEQCIENGKPLEFGQDLVQSYSSDVDSDQVAEGVFDHRLLYPEYPEFESDDLKQTQAELAQARRHNRQLQADVDRYRTVVEQMQADRIAGPIVRARLWWLEKWKRLRASKNEISRPQKLPS